MATAASKYQIGNSTTIAQGMPPPIAGDIWPITGQLFFCTTDQYYYRLMMTGTNPITYTIVGIATQFSMLTTS